MASIDDVIDGFYETSTRPNMLPDAVLEAHRLFRSPAGSLYIQNLRQDRGRMAGAEAAVAFGFDERFLRAYWERYYALNPMFHLTKTLRPGTVATEADTARMSSPRRYRDGEFFNDWARPQNFDHVMGEFVERRGDGVLIMAVWRTKNEGAYAAEETAAFGRLNRHITRVLDVGRRLRTAEAEMETLIGRKSAAVFTFGADGCLRQSNATGDALLSAGIALGVEGGRLRTHVAEDQAPLDRMIACALDRRLAPWAENAALPIRRRDGRPALVARALAVAQRFDPFGPDRAASAILIVEGFEAEEDPGERLRRRFGLSPAQLRVALQMRDGRTPAQAAARLGLSVETVRSHLRALFERTGTRRQAELAMRLRQEGE